MTLSPSCGPPQTSFAAIDATDYKHVVLGLIFLKNISDSFQELFDKLSAELGADREDRDEYAAENRRKLGVWRDD